MPRRPWAGQALTAKNSVTAAYAQLVEEAFERRLLELPAPDAPAPANDDAVPSQAEEARQAAAIDAEPADRGGRRLALTKRAGDCRPAPLSQPGAPSVRGPASVPCLWPQASNPHHLGFTQPRALGRKASDEFAVPLCRSHHRAVHAPATSWTWWKAAGIDPILAARKLWKQTRVNEGRIGPERTRHGSYGSGRPIA